MWIEGRDFRRWVKRRSECGSVQELAQLVDELQRLAWAERVRIGLAQCIQGGALRFGRRFLSSVGDAEQIRLRTAARRFFLQLRQMLLRYAYHGRRHTRELRYLEAVALRS